MLEGRMRRRRDSMRRKSLHPAPANTQRREGFIFGKNQHRSVPVCKSPGCVSATEWRQVVATGASPWILFQTAFFSPSGTTGVSAALFMSSLRDSRSLFFSVHGLAPVATTCRPVGTTSHSFSQFLCSKTQCFVHRNFFSAMPIGATATHAKNCCRPYRGFGSQFYLVRGLKPNGTWFRFCESTASGQWSCF